MVKNHFNTVTNIKLHVYMQNLCDHIAKRKKTQKNMHGMDSITQTKLRQRLIT